MSGASAFSWTLASNRARSDLTEPGRRVSGCGMETKLCLGWRDLIEREADTAASATDIVRRGPTERHILPHHHPLSSSTNQLYNDMLFTLANCSRSVAQQLLRTPALALRATPSGRFVHHSAISSFPAGTPRSTGSGQGGKAEKEAAKKAKLAAAKQKEKDKAARDKLKLKEQKDKDKLKAARVKQKEKDAAVAAKKKAAAAKAVAGEYSRDSSLSRSRTQLTPLLRLQSSRKRQQPNCQPGLSSTLPRLLRMLGRFTPTAMSL